MIITIQIKITHYFKAIINQKHINNCFKMIKTVIFKTEKNSNNRGQKINFQCLNFLIFKDKYLKIMVNTIPIKIIHKLMIYSSKNYNKEYNKK